jgi:hypothetical protein
VDEREAEPKGDLGDLQPFLNLAIAEASETNPEVTLVPPQGSPEALIQSEDKPAPSKDLSIIASTFPDPISFSEQANLLTDIRDDNFSAEGQISTHAAVNATFASSPMISVEVAGTQCIVLINGKSDSFIAEDFAWTCGGNPAISHVKVIARGNSEVHMVISLFR